MTHRDQKQVVIYMEGSVGGFVKEGVEGGRGGVGVAH